jgi:hypothetical protein
LRVAVATAVVSLFGLAAAGLAVASVPTPDVAPASAQQSSKPSQPTPDRATAKKKTKKKVSRPLKATPPLGAGSYVFPVVGDVGYGDSYGVSRPDAPGGWHHGDDLFAPIGAPVVAVTDGTLEKVGWQKLGGWRLWLYDSAGNGFYYAHLSGYTPLGLHRTHVRAGQVLGFVGDTGDADGGASHLHFEIHPAVLSSLGEDGAVDPTSYLQSWRRVQHVRAGNPLHPAFPPGYAGQEAARTFRELLTVHPPVRRIEIPALSPSGGIQPIVLDDLSPLPLVTAGPPLAVITGVIQVIAPAGEFRLQIGWGALLQDSAPQAIHRDD